MGGEISLASNKPWTGTKTTCSELELYWIY